MRPMGDLVDVDHLVEEFQALDAVMRRGMFARLVELARRRLVQRLDGERGFAAARNAGDAGERAQRNFRRDVLQIVAARADHFQPAIVHRPCGAWPGSESARMPDEIFARSGFS